MEPYERNNGRNVPLVNSNGFDFNSVRRHAAQQRQNNPRQTAHPRQARPSGQRRPTPRNIRNSPNSKKGQRYNASMKKNPHLITLTRKAAAIALSAALALGGVAGYGISSIQNTVANNSSYSLDQYDSSEMFSATDNLIKKMLLDNAQMPEDIKDRAVITSYSEMVTSSNEAKLAFTYDYYDVDAHEQKSDQTWGTLPADFTEYVYNNYREVKEIEQNTPEEEKGRVSYWLQINSAVNNLEQGLTTYVSKTQDNDYAKSAQSILDNSSTNTVDTSLTNPDTSRTDDGDER